MKMTQAILGSSENSPGVPGLGQEAGGLGSSPSDETAVRRGWRCDRPLALAV